MTQKMFKIMAVGVCGLALTGCTGSTDPAEAGLFDNIKNLSTGEYDRQIAEKDAQAAAIIANNNASQARINQKRSQSAANSGEIQALRNQLNKVQAQASAARAQVASDPVKLQKLNALDGQLRGIRSDVNSGAVSSATRSELNRVSAAISALTS